MGLNAKQLEHVTNEAKKAAEDAAKKSAETVAKNEIGPAAKTEVATQLKAAFGVTNLDLSDIGIRLRPKVRDPEISNEPGKAEVKDFAQYKQVLQGKTSFTTHRYTIEVPDEGEHSVLNLGHGDKGRDLPDAGISARTFSHIHLHTQNAESSSMVALGGPTGAKRDGLIDPKAALGLNKGISAVTNGHLWAEAQEQLNLASYKSQAVLRAHEKQVRVQADKANVEVGSGESVVVGGAKNVSIVANSDVSTGDNAYGTAFTKELTEKAGLIAGKDLVAVQDIWTACALVWNALTVTDEVYKKGSTGKEPKKNDVHKTTVDGIKAMSSILRLIAGKDAGGQVKIAAETFASMTGMVGASMYGHLSASVSSLLSASVVGGTASLKGIKWASVWARDGLSLRTKNGSASLKSDTGKVGIIAKDEVNVASEAGVNIGGDGYAELKSNQGYAFVAAPKTSRMCAGFGSGMGVVLTSSAAYIGDVSEPQRATGKPKNGTYIGISPGANGKPAAIFIQTPGSAMKFGNKEIRFKGKRADIL